jgi:hypothetical protein
MLPQNFSVTDPFADNFSKQRLMLVNAFRILQTRLNKTKNEKT